MVVPEEELCEPAWLLNMRKAEWRSVYQVLEGLGVTCKIVIQLQQVRGSGRFSGTPHTHAILIHGPPPSTPILPSQASALSLRQPTRWLSSTPKQQPGP